MSEPTSNRRWFRFSLRTLFGVVMVVGVILGFRDWLDPTNDQPFDRQTWLADTNNRYQMLDDLMQRHLHIGMSRDEVRRLLGHETTYAFGSEYEVGYWENDADFLVVQYDSSGRLIEFRADGY